jgi:HEAT repeat protein
MEAADDAFKAMGTNAVPFLIETLEEKASKVGEFVDKQIADYDLKHPKGVSREVRGALPSAYRIETRRETAAFFLGKLGPAAEAAIPVLFKIYTDTNEGWRVEHEVGSALRAMGEKNIVLFPHFLEWLTNSNPAVQATGANFLETIGPKARPAVPDLLRTVESTNLNVAEQAARALWSIDRRTNVAVRIYTRMLQHTNGTWRQLGIIYLGKMGPAAAEAAPAIEPLLRDPDSTVRGYAEKTLRAIDPARFEASQQQMNKSSASNLDRLIKMLREGQFRERFTALQLVGLYGAAAKPAVPTLIEALDGFSPPGPFMSGIAKMNSQRDAAEALAQIGPDAEAAVSALIARVQIRSHFQPAFCKALGHIGPAAKDAVPILEQALQDPEPGIRLVAGDALTRIVPTNCSNAVAVLKALQHDPQLAKVWRGGKDGVGYPTDQLDFDSPACRHYRLSAAVPLWKLHLEPESPVPALLQEMGKRESADATWCIELLGDLGPEANSALPVLSRLVGPDKSTFTRRAAAIAIRRIDPKEAERLNLPGVLAVP